MTGIDRDVVDREPLVVNVENDQPDNLAPALRTRAQGIALLVVEPLPIEARLNQERRMAMIVARSSPSKTSPAPPGTTGE
jgi:hypothetical protein